MKTTNGEFTANFAVTASVPQEARTVAAKKGKIPTWLKAAYTAFMAVLIPVYWQKYGPTNFLYFCDVALLLTLAAVWMENALLASMAAVGILVPQLLWCADFGAHFLGFSPLGMTDYMFDSNRPMYLRGLSLFHGWLPFMLLFLVMKLGYDRRALRNWTVLAWVLMLIAFFFMPVPGTVLSNPNTPVNINYVYGLSDAAAQTWMPKYAWLALMLTALPILFYAPTHWVLKHVAAR